jgi:membrane protein insertase Oxa1/YidC/SpoIIIJ
MDGPAGFLDTLTALVDWTGGGSRAALEGVKAGCGLPWWATISGATLGLRLLLVPLRFRAWRNGRLMKLATDHCNRVEGPVLRRALAGEVDGRVRDELFKRQMLGRHAELLKRLRVSPWKLLTALPVSVPAFLSFAAGLRQIEFPGDDGVAPWIWSHFGEADVASVVPVVLANFLYIESARRASVSARAPQKGRAWRAKIPFLVGHSVNLVSCVILSQVPSCVNLFIFTSTLAGLLESKFLLPPRLADRPGPFGNFVKNDFARRIQLVA